MVSKKYVFTILIILFLVSLSAINAADNTTTDDASYTASEQTALTPADSIQYDDLNQEIREAKKMKTVNKTRQTSTKESSTAVNNFTSLYDELTREDSAETVSVSLEGDNKYTITERIVLNKNIKNLTIEGNGRIIDGNNQYQFLYINQSCNLVINNLTIQNCNLEGNPEDIEYVGGAIELNYGKVLLNNTRFVSNNITALYVAPKLAMMSEMDIQNINNSNLTIINSLFDSNKATNGSGAIKILNFGNVTLRNNIIKNNYGPDAGAVYYYGFANTTLTVDNSTFDSNGGYDETNTIFSNTSALRIDTQGEASITNSNFQNNIGGSEGTLSYNGHDYSTQEFDHTEERYWGSMYNTVDYFYLYESYTNLTIKDTNFTSNTGINTAGAVLSNGNVTLDGVNFINNTLRSVEEDIYYGEGIAILSNSTLCVNNSNFEQNGLPADIDLETSKIYNAKGSAIYQMKKSLQVDNSNFTSNIGGMYGSPIVSDNGPSGPSSGNVVGGYYQIIINKEIKNVLINNSKFEDNREIITEVVSTLLETILVKESPGISVRDGSLVVDNTKFISNKGVVQLANNGYFEDEYGVISFESSTLYDVAGRSFVYTCNVTNCLFDDNEPSNFIIEDNMIRLKFGNANDGFYMIYGMTDNYIPTMGNVTIYVDDNTEPITAQLTSNVTEIYDISGKSIIGSEITDIKIDYPIPETATKLRVIIDQGEESVYNEKQDFYNNEYIFIVPHNYTLTVNATNPVQLGENTTIKGKVYFPITDGEVVSNGDTVKLYINGTYITSTKTNETGEYEFNYTTTALGTQNVTIELNMTNSSLILTNNTIFDVITQTVINIEVNDTTYGIETLIKGNITDNNNKTMPNTNITVYVNTDKYDITTNNDGEFTIPYTPTTVRNNYISAFFRGNTTHMETTNAKAFRANKINTTTSASTPTVGETTFTVTVTGDDDKKITNGSIIVYDENNEIVASHSIKDITTVNLNNLPGGKYTVNVTYPGDEIYNPSSTTTNLTIKKEAYIDMEVINDTEGNVEIEIRVTDKNRNPLPEEEIIVTLPDGTNKTMITDTNGKLTVKDTTTPQGTKTVTATVPATDEIIGTTEEKTFTIEPDYNKIIEEMNKTIQEQNDTIKDQNETINNQNKTINDQNKTINDQNKTINDQEKQINELEETLDTLNRTSVLTAIPENGTVDDNKVTVTLTNKQGTPIRDAPINVTNSKGETIATAKTNDKGIAVIPVNTQAGTENITISYPGSDKFTSSSTTETITTNKNNVTVTVDPVEGIIGEDITLTAHVKDNKGNPVNGGNLVFKLNGKTLRTDGSFNSTASPWKFQVKDGKVTVTIKADLYLRNIKNITASYSGSYKYEEAKSSTVTAQIKKRNAKVKLTVTPKTQKQYQTITLTAKLTDTTPDHKNMTAISTDTKVIFKINGKTIKDEEGNNILVKVVNGSATYKYTVPQGMAGVTKAGDLREYTVETVLVSDTYYPDTRSESIFTVQRSSTTMDISKITVNTKNTLNIQAGIKDYRNKNVIGNNTVTIKINGKTYINPKTNATQYWTAVNGKVDLKNVQVADDIAVKKVMIVTGNRQAYLGCRNETSNIIKV